MAGLGSTFLCGAFGVLCVGNSCGVEGGKAWAETIAVNTTLQTLDLGGVMLFVSFFLSFFSVFFDFHFCWVCEGFCQNDFFEGFQAFLRHFRLFARVQFFWFF